MEPWEPPAPPDSNTFRIFISTDNHLGYAENCDYPPRQQDSFRAVEEVLENATNSEADILLLGGDLFHDNKPTRKCMVETMKLFRRYVFGNRPVQVEPTNVQAVNIDDTDNEKSDRGSVNWEDENMNVGLPVFIIHGNHDDPAGHGNYSALDMLSTAGLVNYFGKHADIQKMVIKPVILTKGTVKLAIYGIGNIKDERLHQNFRQDLVKFEVPQPKDDYFHILVIHQNRAQKGVKNFIPTDLLPDFIHFIIWGHEHECIIKPEEVHLKDGKTAWLTQPGSTVQTSFVAVEAERKHMAYMDIRLTPNGQNGAAYKFRFKHVEHRRTRPFIYDEIVLSDIMTHGQRVTATDDGVMKFLEKRVKELINIAGDDYRRSGDLEKPLIRIKVEHTGYPLIAPRRFGQLFAEGSPAQWPVANPYELLKFWRKSSRDVQRPRMNDDDQSEAAIDRDNILEAPEIHELVQVELDRNSVNLQVLLKADLFDAVSNFVEKDETTAIKNMVTDQLEGVQEYFGKHVQSGEIANVDNNTDLMERVKKLLEERQKEQLSAQTGSSSSRMSQVDQGASNLGGSSSAARDKNAPARSNGRVNTVDSDDEVAASPRANPRVPAGGSGRGRGRGAGLAERGGARRGAAAARGSAAGGSKRQATLNFGSQANGASASRGAATGQRAAQKNGKREKDATESEEEDALSPLNGSDDSCAEAESANSRPTAQQNGRSKRAAVRNNGAATGGGRRNKKRGRQCSSEEDEEEIQPASSAWGA